MYVATAVDDCIQRASTKENSIILQRGPVIRSFLTESVLGVESVLCNKSAT
jgi:hypothetical protein